MPSASESRSFVQDRRGEELGSSREMTLPILLVVALLAAPASDAPAGGEAPPVPAPPPPPARPVAPGVHYATLPLVSYGSDIGLQLGGVLYVYDIDPNGERGDWGALGLSWTTHGPRSVELKGELFRLGGTSLRTFVQLKASLDTSAPYWGEGAGLVGPGVAPSVPPGAGAPPAPYRYRAVAPWLSWMVRGPLSGPLGWWARLRTTSVSIEDPAPLLTQSAPPGSRGGTSTLVHGGLVYDTRGQSASPRRGVVADASLFGAPPSPLSDFGLGGVDVGLRGYLEPWPGAVLAGRVLYDLKLGEVPFFERTLFEGIGYGEGLGGSGTIRGLARDRLMGEEKVLAGLELRAYLLETHWSGHLQDWGFSLGADAGRARDRGHAPVLAAGAFVGARMMWDRAVVVRMEIGHAGQGAPAFYIAFDEAF
jgi:hypothetical protein